MKALLGLGLFAVPLVVGAALLPFRMVQLAPDTKPMPCEEDEAYVWVDAPHTAKCVALDDLPIR